MGQKEEHYVADDEPITTMSISSGETWHGLRSKAHGEVQHSVHKGPDCASIPSPPVLLSCPSG